MSKSFLKMILKPLSSTLRNQNKILMICLCSIKLTDNIEMGAEPEHEASFSLFGKLSSVLLLCWHPQKDAL